MRATPPFPQTGLSRCSWPPAPRSRLSRPPLSRGLRHIQRPLAGKVGVCSQVSSAVAIANRSVSVRLATAFCCKRSDQMRLAGADRESLPKSPAFGCSNAPLKEKSARAHVSSRPRRRSLFPHEPPSSPLPQRRHSKRSVAMASEAGFTRLFVYPSQDHSFEGGGPFVLTGVAAVLLNAMRLNPCVDAGAPPARDDPRVVATTRRTSSPA